MTNRLVSDAKQYKVKSQAERTQLTETKTDKINRHFNLDRSYFLNESPESFSCILKSINSK